MEEIKLIGFTAFEKDFEMVCKIDNRWEEFRIYCEYSYTYDKFADNYSLKISKVIASQYSDELEKYIPYTFSDEDTNKLRNEMNRDYDYDQVNEWANNLHKHE